MRFVDRGDVDPPDGWADKATVASEDVANATVGERAGAVAQRSTVWTEIKPSLRSASAQKCWYCESIENRSDNAVDHFRPKARVHECEGHMGYWWLAFAQENLRFSCTYCNSYGSERTRGTEGGKRDHFPLWDEEQRAWGPDSPIEAEQPLLLDPSEPGDPGLIWFDETGQATGHPRAHDSEYLTRRVDETISKYHLNQPALVERRRELARWVTDKVAHADQMFVERQGGNPAAEAAYAEAIRDLAEALRKKGEYSAQARCTLLGLRDGRSSVPDAVLSAIR